MTNRRSSNPPAIGSIHEVTVEKLAWGGEALARLQGMVCFIPNGLPGDRVEIQVRSVSNKFLRAEVIQLVENGPGRRNPPCEYDGQCGGCQLQALDYPAQIAAKQVMLSDLFRLLVRCQTFEIAAIVRSPQEFGYRSRTIWHLKNIGTVSLLGYFRRRSHQIVEINRCPLITETLNRCLQDLHCAVRAAPGTLNSIEIAVDSSDSQAVLFLSYESHNRRTPRPADLHKALLELNSPVHGVATDSQRNVSISGLPYLSLEALGFTFRVGSGEFSQVNRLLRATLIEIALKLIDPRPQDCAIDLYCGIGFFTIPLAGLVQHVVGVEASPASIENAWLNARAAGLTNCQFFAERSEDFVLSDDGGYTLAILDPPRTGCHPQVLEWLKRVKIRRVLYISCEPSILTRDLEQLITGGYQVLVVQPFDLFPQTYHIECMALLEYTRRTA